MNVRQQIIQDRVEDTAKQLGLATQNNLTNLDFVFLKYVLSIVTNRSVFDKKLDEDIFDGKMEKQLDAIYFDTDVEDILRVYIIQAKNTNGFSSNTISLIGNGLDWLLNTDEKGLATLDNPKFLAKIREYRSYQRDFGPANIYMTIVFATNGLTSELKDKDEVIQEKKKLINKYQNGTFAEFSLELWGAEELVNRINQLEKKSRKIDQDIKIVYDMNNPSVIKYQAGGVKGLVCSASANIIAEIVNKDTKGAIFDPNIRNFLGLTGTVNSDILSTSVSDDEGILFWFLNNGITIICDDWDLVADPTTPIVKVKNLQIVNGCQTSTALAIAQKRGLLKNEVRVLLRIYETTDEALVNRIVLTTNNQNRITTRDLKANDPIQVDFQKRFREYDCYYERKPREYDKDKDIDSNKVFTNEIVAQSYLAIVLKKPSDSSRRKYKVWKDYYNQIFNYKSATEPFIISVLLYQAVNNELKKISSTPNKSDLWIQLCNSASFHVARVVSFLYHGDEYIIPTSRDKYTKTIKKIKLEIQEIRTKGSVLDGYIVRAVDILETVINREFPQSSINIENIIKSSELDNKIDAELYKNYRKT